MMAPRILAVIVMLISITSGFAMPTRVSGLRSLLAATTPPPDLANKSAEELSKIGLAAVTAAQSAAKNSSSKDLWYPGGQVLLPTGQKLFPAEGTPKSPFNPTITDVVVTVPKPDVLVVRFNATFDGSTDVLDKRPGLLVFVWDEQQALWRPLAAATFDTIKQSFCGLAKPTQANIPQNLTQNATLGAGATAADGAAAVKVLETFYKDMELGKRGRLYNGQYQTQYPDGSGSTTKKGYKYPPPTNASAFYNPYVTSLNNGEMLVVSSWATHAAFVRFDGLPMDGSLAPRLFVLQKDNSTDAGYSVDAVGVYQDRETYQPELCGLPPTNNSTAPAPAPNTKPASAGFALNQVLTGIVGIVVALAAIL